MIAAPLGLFFIIIEISYAVFFIVQSQKQR